jgi:hypothetical protein
VWIATVGQVWEIDPGSNHVVLTRDLQEAAGAIATGEGAVWITGLLTGLDQIDPVTGHLHRGVAGTRDAQGTWRHPGSILCSACLAHSDRGPVRFFFTGDHVRGAPPSVAAGLGSIWAVAFPPPVGTSVVWRIDPTSGSAKSIPVPFAPIGVAIGEDALWSVGTNGEVARIDGRGKVVQVITAAERGATQVAVGLHAVWILNPTLGTVTRIDPRTNEVVATIQVGEGTSAIATGQGSVWVTRTQR